MLWNMPQSTLQLIIVVTAESFLGHFWFSHFTFNYTSNFEAINNFNDMSKKFATIKNENN
jgi:hypothetical protein